MREVTNWDKYHQRVQVSQRFLWTIWRAYDGLMHDISFNRPIKIVELGCGTGYHTLQMTKLYPVTKVTLVDFNADVIEDTERRMAGLRCEKEFLLRDLFDLELGEKYDIVHSQGLLEKLHLWIYPDETAISREEFAAALESNGLEILKMKGCHFIELGAVCRLSVKRG